MWRASPAEEDEQVYAGRAELILMYLGIKRKVPTFLGHCENYIFRITEDLDFINIF